ncbi:MAG: hypothetical protein ACXVGN_01045 [Mycobacteriaceae bacterium]
MNSAQWRAALPFSVVGLICILTGGIVSAATAFAPSEHSAWAVAYLVLVAGAAQVGLGVGQALLAPSTPAVRVVVAEFLAWNVGNAAVLVGTISGVAVLVDVGGVLLLAALILLILGVRGCAEHWKWPLYAFRILVLILLISIPIGLVLAAVRPG